MSASRGEATSRIQVPQDELPVFPKKALIAIVVLTVIITVNMNYGWYKDQQARDIPPLDKTYALYKMLEWMEAGGSYAVLPPDAKVEVRNDLGVCKCIRGVAATTDIELGETILEIPFSQIIFDAQEQPLPACMPEAQWDVRLASALLREKAKGPGSPFFYYIQALPDEILAAVTLDDEDLEKVKYEVGRSKLAAQRPWMETVHLRCLEGAPDLIANASWHEFRWAIAVVQSRSFGLLGKLLEEDGAPTEKRSDGSGLVPLMDLLNHHETHSAHWETSPDGRSVLLKATRPIAEGKEVCDSYGPKGNDELLISYGFVIKNNPHEYMALFDTVNAAVDWLFEKFPCMTTMGSEMVSRGASCREDVLQLVRKRLEEVPLSPVVAAMKADSASAYYAQDIERMGLFVDGEVDTRLTASFETAFSHSCFICARETLPGTELGETRKDASLQGAVDNAKRLVDKAVDANIADQLETYTANGRSDLAIKVRLLELLLTFGIGSKGEVDGSAWRKPTPRAPPTTYKEQVLKDYNESKLKLLLAKLDAVAS